MKAERRYGWQPAEGPGPGVGLFCSRACNLGPFRNSGAAREKGWTLSTQADGAVPGAMSTCIAPHGAILPCYHFLQDGPGAGLPPSFRLSPVYFCCAAADRWTGSWRKGNWNYFSCPVRNCSLGFILSLSLCICCLACILLFAWMPPWAASQSACFSSGQGRPGSIPNLPPAPMCRRLTVVTLELQSTELFEEVAKKATSGPNLQIVGVRSPESAFPPSTSQGDLRQAVVWEMLKGLRVTKSCFWQTLLKSAQNFTVDDLLPY